MNHILIEISKYLIIFSIAIYAFMCFFVLKSSISNQDSKAIYTVQNKIMFFIHFLSNVIIFVETESMEVLIYYVFQIIFFVIILIVFHLLYPKASKLLLNNMCMLLAIGFIMLLRLDSDEFIKQFIIAVGSVLVTMVIPFFIHKMKFLSRLCWGYGVIGILLLAAIKVVGNTSYGAQLSFTIGGISVQPSEFVKIIFVFFVASMLYKNIDSKRIIKATVVAGLHVLILVISKDLGGALIFFITYLVMIYVATRKAIYALGGLGIGALGSVAGYFLFNHVRVRVLAWKDPWSVIDGEGYQITQSLFAIGTGGWFGLGLYQGLPNKIPVVEQDFIFAAISEELGGVFALCLILICISCFIMFLNIAMQMRNQFYKLVALGLGTVYGFQVFLTVGGVIKFIPSTGVTLPLVSYGGSSLFSTLVIFAIIQGLYIIRHDEGEEYGIPKKEDRRYKRFEE